MRTMKVKTASLFHRRARVTEPPRLTEPNACRHTHTGGRSAAAAEPWRGRFLVDDRKAVPTGEIG